MKNLYVKMFVLWMIGILIGFLIGKIPLIPLAVVGGLVSAYVMFLYGKKVQG